MGTTMLIARLQQISVILIVLLILLDVFLRNALSAGLSAKDSTAL